jgi:hypothetical protein
MTNITVTSPAAVPDAIVTTWEQDPWHSLPSGTCPDGGTPMPGWLEAARVVVGRFAAAQDAA